MSAYSKFHKILKGPVKLVFGLKVHGVENLPEDEAGYLVCANHTSLLDVFLIAVAIEKRQVMFMAKAELFKIPVLKSIIKSLGAFPVNRGGADLASVKRTIGLLKEGNLVGIFPQGTRQRHVDPRTTEVKHGVGMFSYRAGTGVIPIFIKTKDNHVRLFKKTDLYIGESIKNEELGFEGGGMEEYTAAAEKIFDRICTIGETVASGDER